ncbi:serine acetyltransferase [Lacticaseibacillus pabuli]|uniref:Serine acetyltransferase n=1 Tax=Lacticaseibacillus pabuli TaxID=3025672 RepID=A0ABY7WSR6_9LACO|nr:serine acetyltransferase [Lacticaseibacillus sp. KACC 23028]WDF83218.1 serine acetyltransferase [Lacticaseibacillus sp. KACC 23028]
MSDFNELMQQNCFADSPETRRAAAEQLEHDYSCEVHCNDMDHSVQFAHHGHGCIIAAAKLSAGVVIYQNVTIGSNMKFNLRSNQWEQVGDPVIGKKVVIADGAKVLGPIIVGDGALIAAGAIITRDVPAHMLAYGVNQIRPLPDDYDLVYHMPMPSHAEIESASKALIKRYEDA